MSNVVPRVNSVIKERANTLGLSLKSPSKPPRRTASTSKQIITISGVNHCEQSLVKEEIYERSSEFIFQLNRNITIHITIAGISGIAGVINVKLIRFYVF